MMEISNAELEVMQVLWRTHPASANQIIQRLNKQKSWHEKTVKTFLSRLVKKEAITFIVEGRQYLYSPVISEQAFQQQESVSLVSRVFNGRVSPLVAGFANNTKLSADDIQDLKKLIQDWEQQYD